MEGKKELTGYPFIDKPWLKYYTNTNMEDHLQGNTVYTNIYRNNASCPNDIALEYFGRKITYGQMFERVKQTKNALEAYGVKADDKVILFTSAAPETVYVVLALCRIGAVANMINPLFTREECFDRINETEAELMIVLDQLYDRIADAIPQTCVRRSVIVPVCQSMPPATRMLAGIKLKKRIDYSNTVIAWSSFLNAGEKSSPDAPYEMDRALVMVYSSGSTGASKGIVLTNDGINATIRHYISPDFPYERGYTFLQMIPVWFSTGIVLSVLMPLCVGITVILEPVFSKETFAKDLKKYRPNLTLTATSLWLYAARCSETRHADLSAMHYPVTGGEKVLDRDEENINSFLALHGCRSKLLKGYGMCELGSTITTDSDTYRKTGATGYPITDVIVAAFDPITDMEKRYGERGELRVCSPARMKEYFRNSEATKRFSKQTAKEESGAVPGISDM